jgi:hypothetical protein
VKGACRQRCSWPTRRIYFTVLSVHTGIASILERAITCVARRGLNKNENYVSQKKRKLSTSDAWECSDNSRISRNHKFSSGDVSMTQVSDKDKFIVARVQESMRSVRCQQESAAGRGREKARTERKNVQGPLDSIQHPTTSSAAHSLVPLLSVPPPALTAASSHFYKLDKSVIVWHGFKSAGCCELIPPLLSNL